MSPSVAHRVDIGTGGAMAGILAFTIGIYIWGIFLIVKDAAGRSWGWADRKLRGVF